jgi:hypothetical protein
MRFRNVAAATVAAAAMAVVPATAALAIDCTNLSRPELNTTNLAPTYSFYDGAIQIWIRGNWAWVSTPDDGAFWTFIPPGTGEQALADEMGLVVSAPGANGNYTAGRHDDLLGQAQALCAKGRLAVLMSGNEHGIVAEPQCTTG